MGQFLRFALLLILAVLGFGTGVCGAFGLVTGLLDRSGGPENFSGVAVMFGVVGLVIAALCFFAVRALMHSLRRSSVPGSAPPPPPGGAPPPPPAA